MTPSPLLNVRGLDVHYGRFQALFHVAVHVAQGEVVALIGGNSAGKSTLLRAIAALLAPSAGTIVFSGTDLGDLKPHQVVALGVSLVPEGRHVFGSLTVRENLLVGAHSRRARNAIRQSMEEVYELFPILRQRANIMGNELSGGEQQMLAIGRSLMSGPALMMLDEISQGLSPLVIKAVYRTLSAISRTGTAVLLVEQDVRRSVSVADRVYAMVRGRAVCLGVPGSLTEDDLKKACFGFELQGARSSEGERS
ncbi:MAG: ABC transporter ATP-binding protein [Desulfomonilaceae bacterium]|nr:ABC transporter ATP-binding protein [Desulfomonilaceae bacterium]